MMTNRSLRDMIFPEFSGGSYSPDYGGGATGFGGASLGELGPAGPPPLWAQDRFSDLFYSALYDFLHPARDVPFSSGTGRSSPYLVASNGPIVDLANSDQPSGTVRSVYLGIVPKGGVLFDRWMVDGVIRDFRVELGEEVTVTAQRLPPSVPAGQPPSAPSAAATIPPAGGPQPSIASLGESQLAPASAGPQLSNAARGGYSIEPPPPIRGGTSDALYFKPGWWQVYQNSRQEAQKADPDLDKVYSGLIVSPLAYLEEYLVRPLLNVPDMVVNTVITAGQHLDRGSLWLQQDEWGEAAAEGLEAVVDLSLAFLDVVALLESLGSEGAPAGGRRPASRASLAEEIPASVPQEMASSLGEEVTAVQGTTSFNVGTANGRPVLKLPELNVKMNLNSVSSPMSYPTVPERVPKGKVVGASPGGQLVASGTNNGQAYEMWKFHKEFGTPFEANPRDGLFGKIEGSYNATHVEPQLLYGDPSLTFYEVNEVQCPSCLSRTSDAAVSRGVTITTLSPEGFRWFTPFGSFW